MKDVVEYNLTELQIARDSSHPRHLNPPAVPSDHKVLDLGCGAGQILIATRPGVVSFGCDIDMKAMRLGQTLTQHIKFACCNAEALPYKSGTFDMVIARASLPYTHIQRSLINIRRVLKTGGKVWMTLHSLEKVFHLAKQENFKTRVLLSFYIVNGVLFHLTQQQVRFPKKGYASFQTDSSITKALERAGFGDIKIERGKHFLVTATAV